MKKYLVTVKKIQATDMIISENSGQKAIIKVADLMNKCVENNITLDKIFDRKPNFIYKIKPFKSDE